MRCPACGRECERLVEVGVAVGLGTTTTLTCDRCAKPIYSDAYGARSLTPLCSRCGLGLRWHVPHAGRTAGWPNACCGWKG